MRLYTTTTSERGKSVGKGGNTEINTEITAMINGEITSILHIDAKYQKHLKRYFVEISSGGSQTKCLRIAESQNAKCQNCNMWGSSVVESSCMTCGGTGWLS